MANELREVKKVIPFQIDEFDNYPRISDLEDCIKETVVGQDELIKGIATSLYNAHYMGIKCVDL